MKQHFISDFLKVKFFCLGAFYSYGIGVARYVLLRLINSVLSGMIVKKIAVL